MMASPAQTERVPLPAIDRYFDISLFLLVATGVFAVVTTGKLDPVSTVVPAVAVIYKGVGLFRGRGPELPVRVATGLVLAYFLFFPIDLWIVSRGLAEGAPNPGLYAGLLSAVHLMVFATLVRLYSARTRRDQMFLATLAVTCMLASAILTVDTIFLVSLALFLLLSVSTFVGLEIRRSAEGTDTPPMGMGSPAARKLHRAVALTSVMVSVSALLIGAVIFFLIPRFTAGYLSALSVRPSLMTGFTDNVTLGQIGELKKNPAVVMRIHVDGDPRRVETVHWRGIVLTNFDGHRWYRRPQEQVAVFPSFYGEYQVAKPVLPPSEFTAITYSVLLEPIATDAVFVAPHAVAVRGQFGPGIGRPEGRPTRSSYLGIDATGTIQNPAHTGGRVRYEVDSQLPAVPAALLRSASRDYPYDIRNTYLQLPVLDPRIPKLAREITAGVANPFDKASRTEQYLRTQFGYTLDLTRPPEGDPLAYFLFVKRAGHCEYFASAMAVMLRSEGIPARMVTGFLPGQYNDIGGDFIVRASDAHAWVEVYFPAYGWIPFDPTPPAAESPGGMFARLGFYWDWFQYTWNEWFVGYDFVHQVTLAQNLQRISATWTARLKAMYRARRDQTLRYLALLERRTEKSPYLLPSILAILLAILLVMRGRALGSYILARYRLLAHRGKDLPPSLAALEYREMLKLLARRGWQKQAAQTPREFAAAIPEPAVAGPVAHLTEMYQSARFGSHAANANDMAELLASLKTLLRGSLK